MSGNIFATILLLQYVLRAASGNTINVVSTFVPPVSGEFNQIAVHKETGNVYVGGINRIYQLDQNLELKYVYKTGVDGVTNVNTVLVIDYVESNLIVCGSAAGNCSILSLDDITKVKLDVPYGTGLTGDTYDDVVAFTGLGHSNTSVLYMAFGGNIKKILVRSLVSSNNFKELKVLTITSLFSSRNKPVYAFSVGDYSYFLFNDFYPTMYRVKLDSSSKANVSSSCVLYCNLLGNRGLHKVLVAATAATPGRDLAEEMGIGIGSLVLFLVFTGPYRNDSILCAYPLERLDVLFEQRGVQSTFSVTNYTEIILEFSKPSTIMVLSDENITVAVLASSDGKIKKLTQFMYEYPAVSAIVYDEQKVVFSGLNLSKMVLDVKSTHLYAMSGDKIYKIAKIRDCEKYDLCEDCVRKNPLCEWCINQNRCMTLHRCSSNSTLSSSTVAFNSRKCSKIQYTTSTSIYLPKDDDIVMLNTSITKTLPNDAQDLKCQYRFLNQSVFNTYARVMGHFILCLTPTKSTTPVIEQSDHVSSILSLTWSQQDKTSKNLVLGYFTLRYYDCSTYTSCTTCMTLKSKCCWGYYAYSSCEDENWKYCDILNEGNCSIIMPEKNDTLEVLVPYGSVQRIKMGISLGKIPYVRDHRRRFACRFEIEGHTFLANSILNHDIIFCDAMNFKYNANRPSVNVPVNIVDLTTNYPTILDNPSGIQVVIYRCAYMADSCETCATIDVKFSCGWCMSSNGCTVKEDCAHGLNWIGRNDSCPSKVNILETMNFLLPITIVLLTIAFTIAVVLLSRRIQNLKNTNEVELQLVKRFNVNNL